MAELKISSGEDLEKWLEGKPREVSVVLASRIALRVFPLVGDGSGISRFIKDIVLPTLWANILPWVAAKHPRYGNDWVLAAKVANTTAEAAQAITGADDYACAATIYVIYAATDATSAIAATAATAATAAASAATAAIAAVTSDAYTTAEATTFWDALTADCRRLESEGDHVATVTLAGMPLWPDGVPDWVEVMWRDLTRVLLDAGDSWQVWINWYEARLHGRPTITAPADIVRELDLNIAQMDKKLWQGEPPALNAEMQRLIDEALAEAREREGEEEVEDAEIPPIKPASLKPVWRGDVLTLPSSPAEDDLSGASIDAAFASLADQVDDVINDISDESNIDRRVVKYFEKLRDKMPTGIPDELTLFSLGHDEEKLSQLVKLQSQEWPPIIAAGIQSLHLQFERVLDKFPEWRALKAEHGNDTFTKDEVQSASKLVSTLADELVPLEDQGVVDSQIVSTLQAFAKALVDDHTPEEISLGNDLLAADALESVNNTLKTLASWVLEKVKIFAKSANSGVDEIAEELGQDLTIRTYKQIKKLLKIMLYGASGTTGVGAPIIVAFPNAFEWLQSVWNALIAFL